MPKKNKTVQNKNQASPEAGGIPSSVKPGKVARPRRAVTAGKATARDARSETGGKPKVSTRPETGASAEPSDEQIRIRAYFISERRRRFDLPGDADSDWLEAKQQLLSESGSR